MRKERLGETTGLLDSTYDSDQRNGDIIILRISINEIANEKMQAWKQKTKARDLTRGRRNERDVRYL